MHLLYTYFGIVKIHNTLICLRLGDAGKVIGLASQSPSAKWRAGQSGSASEPVWAGRHHQTVQGTSREGEVVRDVKVILLQKV